MTNETMTLGEALTVRADMQQRLAELRGRLLAVAKVQEGETLTAALARRDVLAVRHKVHRELAAAASEQSERYSPREIKMTATVDVAQLRRTVDELARERRELDVALQAANWANTLTD
jgi:hypothetical protein